MQQLPGFFRPALTGDGKRSVAYSRWAPLPLKVGLLDASRELQSRDAGDAP